MCHVCHVCVCVVVSSDSSDSSGWKRSNPPHLATHFRLLFVALFAFFAFFAFFVFIVDIRHFRHFILLLGFVCLFFPLSTTVYQAMEPNKSRSILQLWNDLSSISTGNTSSKRNRSTFAWLPLHGDLYTTRLCIDENHRSKMKNLTIQEISRLNCKCFKPKMAIYRRVKANSNNCQPPPVGI